MCVNEKHDCRRAGSEVANLLDALDAGVEIIGSAEGNIVREAPKAAGTNRDRHFPRSCKHAPYALQLLNPRGGFKHFLPSKQGHNSEGAFFSSLSRGTTYSFC